MSMQDKLRQLADQAEKAARDAAQKAGELAHDKRETLTESLDKVGAQINEKTDGKYSDKIASAKDQILKGVDKVAEQRPEADDESTPPAAPAPHSGSPDHDVQTPRSAADPIPPTTTPQAPSTDAPMPDPATLQEPPRS